MRRNLIWAFVIAISMLSSEVRAQDTVLFDFNNNTEFDNSAMAGVTMSAMGATDTVVMTSLEVLAPEIEETMPDVFVLTGNTISAVTSIGTSNNSVGINNQSIGNTDYRVFAGIDSGTEGNDFNLGESWVVEFDTDVIVQEINFASIDVDGFAVVEIEGVATPFQFVDGTPNDDFADPFAGLVITAGTDITFSVDGAPNASVRISEITVETVGADCILGDVDLSGAVNFLDISPFIALVSTGGFQKEADLDLNGSVNFLDISPFIAALTNQ